MRKVIISLLFIALCQLGSYAQVTKEKKESKNYKQVKLFDPDTINGFNLIDRFAMYPDGIQGIQKYISENLEYPEKALKKEIEGIVVLSYVIDTTGKVTDVKVVQGVHPLLNKEAIRVIKSMDQWLPAIQSGEKIRFQYKQPIRFKL